MKKNWIRLIVFYILGFLLYYAVLFLTQTIVLNILGLTREEVNIFLDNPIINVIMFTGLFIFVNFVVYTFDKTSVEELNEALKEMKERVKTNEEQIRAKGYDNNYSSSDSNGNI